MFKKSSKFTLISWFLVNVVFHQTDSIYEPRAKTGELCVIPFVYKGNTYHDCITLGTDKAWCYVDDDFDKWEYCATPPNELIGCGLANPNVTKEEVKEILSEHNKVRGKVPALRMRKLTWNSELAQRAQFAANRCAGDHVETTLCANRLPVGQNLAYSYFDKDYPNVANWTSIIKSWSDEKPYYDRKSNKCKANTICGHYTQVVWDHSYLVGCGKALCHGMLNGNVLYSIQYYCDYFYTGNVIGNFPYQESSDSKCKDCYLFDTSKVFRCDENQLCESCKNGTSGCIGLEDIKKLSDSGKICADTDRDCGLNASLCGANKDDLPEQLVEYLKKCKKTCGTCK